jgi:ATP-dependent helicase Lhr and Lhr-like helicase
MRTGDHAVGELSLGVILPKFRGDLLRSAAVVERMLAGEIETTAVPANPFGMVHRLRAAVAATSSGASG